MTANHVTTPREQDRCSYPGCPAVPVIVTAHGAACEGEHTTHLLAVSSLFRHLDASYTRLEIAVALAAALHDTTIEESIAAVALQVRDLKRMVRDRLLAPAPSPEPGEGGDGGAR